MSSREKNNNLQLGLTIPQGWRGGDLPLEEENNPFKQYEFSKSVAIAADNLGFHSIYAYDHLIPHYKDDIEKNIFECFTLISSIAAITNKIKIGQIVACNSYRTPSLLAKMLSTLDVISNGRIELGIGAGWYEQEYIAYGYDFRSNISRIKQLDESLSIIKAIWTAKKPLLKANIIQSKRQYVTPNQFINPYPVIIGRR
jgi:alkanesulfonate monooxygenase SsuD/methylene tetrahydromethanopterin reductase-like flavin-dependent oxidoreductase (luciferase family)